MNNKVLIIFEGEKSEQMLFKRLKCLYPSLIDYEVSFVGTNIHSFKKFFEVNYTLDNTDINIKNVIYDFVETNPSNKQQRHLKNIELLNKEYTQVILIIDFEPHHFSNPCTEDFDFIRNIQERLLNEYDDGLLLVDYPMHEAFKDVNSLEDIDLTNLKISHSECNKYKQIVGNRTSISQIDKVDKEIFVNIFEAHESKFKLLSSIETDDYFPNDYLVDFMDIQINDLLTNKEINVISISSVWYLNQIR